MPVDRPDLIERVLEENERQVTQVGRVRFYASSRATVTVGDEAGRLFQLCQIQFEAGHIFVHFPYLGDSPGLLRDFLRDANGTRTHDLTDGGKLVSSHVKFAHKLDGRTHFSQDGKIRTTVIRESIRLDGPIGRIFELSAFYPGQFQQLKKPKRDRVYVPFLFSTGLPSALMIYAEWRRVQGIESTIDTRSGITGPIADVLDRRSGYRAPRVHFGPPGLAQTHILVITCAPVPGPAGIEEGGMFMRGGFDNLERPAGTPIVPGEQVPTGCLAFFYPVHLSAAALARVECIDYDAGAEDG